jgi:hypothetical protein
MTKGTSRINRFILPALILTMAFHQVTPICAQITDPDIPKLHNPFSATYIRENLAESKPRMIFNERILDISRDMLRRVNMPGLVYLVERDKTILDRINQEVLATSRFTDWNPPVYLDVAEICMAVSLALDWTLDDLPESTIKEAKKALIEKGIHPSWEEYGGDKSNAWWINHYNNWNQVCNGE